MPEETPTPPESPPATQAVTSDPYELEAEATNPPIEIPDSEPEPDDDSVVVIDTGAKDLTNHPQTLAEAARVERERRQIADPTDIVITDKTLEEFATGDLTVATPAPEEQAARSAASEVLQEMAEKEAFWRGRALEIRQAWRDAYDQIPELEEKVFQLRQAFYREDNGFYRDGEIKPAWDRAIDQLEDARLEVEARQEELAEFLEEGREAGALPGWLREGIDLEPEMAEVVEPTAEPGEPVIYSQEATDPP